MRIKKSKDFSSKETRVQKWNRISSQLKNKQEIQEVKEILETIENYHTKYQVVDEYLNRLEFLVSILPDGKTKISDRVWIKIMEMENDLIDFLELSREYNIPVDMNDEYWKEGLDLFFNKMIEPLMISYFLWKDLGYGNVRIEPEYAYWELIRQVSLHVNPSKNWISVLRPIIFDIEYLEQIEQVNQQVKTSLTGLSEEEKNSIIYLGRDYYILYMNKQAPVPIPNPVYTIPTFKGINVDISNLEDNMMKYLGKNYTERFFSFIEKSKKSKDIKNEELLLYGKIKLMNNLLDADISVDDISKI